MNSLKIIKNYIKNYKARKRLHVSLKINALLTIAIISSAGLLFTVAIVLLSYIYTLPSWLNILIFSILTIISIPYTLYVTGIVIPTITRFSYFEKNNCPYKLLLKYAVKAGIAMSIYGFSIANLFLISIHSFTTLSPSAITSLTTIFNGMAFLVPYIYTYQFLYKPARAGKLPRWVQRVLGRRNSIVQLRDDIAALADSSEHNTNNSHFTENT